MRFLLSVLTTVALLSPAALAAPIYNPDHNGVHQMKPLHIRHIDEHGHVTYIHDSSDHRPDFCSIPGEEELCRLQIEAANRAPPVFDNGQTTQTIEPSELNPEHTNPEHGQRIRQEHTQDVASNIHANDETITLDDGERVTLHNDPHPRNIYDPSTDPDTPPANTPHVPNINHGLRHMEHVKDDPEYQPPSRPHPRNIKPDGDDIPSVDHPNNINHGANGLRQRERMSDVPDTADEIPSRPHARNINDNPNEDVPVTINHPDNTRNQHGQSVIMHTTDDDSGKKSLPHGQSMHIADDDTGKKSLPHGQSMHIMNDDDTPQDPDIVIDTNPKIGSFPPHPKKPEQHRPIDRIKQTLQNMI